MPGTTRGRVLFALSISHARAWAGLCLVGLLCVVAAFDSTARAAQAISAIEITGNRSVAEETVRSHMTLRPGSPYDEAALDREIQRLFATGLFADISIKRSGTRVIVHVTENPIIGRISIQGNKDVEKSRLEPLLTLKQRDRYTATRAQTETLRLREYYRSLGRVTTTVTHTSKPISDGQVEVTFVVQEGAVSKVESIGFEGNRAFSDKELRDVVSTSESGWLDILKTAAFYDAERVKRDGDLIRRHYHKNGYPDARVTASNARLNEAGTGYRITFAIVEGEHYVMRPAPIDNQMKGVDTSALQPTRPITDGYAYSEEAIDKTVEAMTLKLSEQGHVFARVKAVPTRDETTRTMMIGFRIEEGTKAYAERIDITGNIKTKDYVIRRELRIAEGDPVNAMLLERARKRVEALGFFKKVSLKHAKGSAADQFIITIEVIEDDSRNIGFGVGYSTSEGIVGDLNLGEKNLFGTGQKLNLKLAGSFTRFQAEVGFTEPRFLGSNVAAGFDVFYKDVDFSQYASYKAESIGAKLRATFPIDDNWSTGVNYAFVHNKLYDVGANASPAIKQAIPGYPDSSSTAYNTSSVGYSLTYDGRDNRKRPTQGVFYTLSQDLAGVGGDVRYIRNIGEVRGYYPVNDSITLMGRATGGSITPWGGQDVRLLDLFYKGNDIVRGFAPAGIGPRDTLSANADALGGRNYFSTSAELLFAIPGVPQEMGLRGAIFADAGSLWGTNKTAAALPGIASNSLVPRASVGVGLGWDSPVGTLRVDYAIPISKQASDKTQPLSFGLSPF